MANDWARRVNERSRDGSERPKQLLVVINPFGGTRRAAHVWRAVAAPLFDLAGEIAHAYVLLHLTARP